MKTLLNKIKFKIKDNCSRFLIRFGLYLNSPFLVALGLAVSATTIGKNGKYRVLAMGRSVFTDDLRAMVKFSGQIEYCVIHLGYWQLIFNYFSTAEERVGLEETNYHVTDICGNGKKKYYEFLKKVFPYLRKFIGLEAAFSGNFGYIMQQEVMRVCEDGNIPFIVLHKEAIVVLDSYERFVGRYKGLKLVGSKILFYNDFAKNGILKQKVEGLTPEKARTVGIPRLDNYFYDQKQKNSDLKRLKQITLFSFYPRNSFVHMTKDENILKKIEERSVEFHRNIMSFAEKHPEYQVVIKTKKASYFIDYVNSIYKSFNREITNLRITNSDNSTDLIKNSSVLLGFNSTTLIEGMIINRVLISPDFDDIIHNQMWSLFDRWPSLIHNVKTYKVLEDIFLNPNKYKILNNLGKNDFLATYSFSSEGGACARVEEEIIKTINYGKK